MPVVTWPYLRAVYRGTIDMRKCLLALFQRDASIVGGIIIFFIPLRLAGGLARVYSFHRATFKIKKK